MLKNPDISILSNFLAIFSNFFLDIENFAKYYEYAKFLINCTIQTEITGLGAESALSQPYQSAKSPSCLRLKDDQFNLLVWLLLSLLSLFSYLKALNFARACNSPVSANGHALGNIKQI